ncbi:MAG TPA: BatA domain-containing protein [Pirellulales bacterium]|nr:BatA domain-containing protein [Pirellulales bacterium]
MLPFVHAPLLWGLALLGVPILIHLINRLRHRRVNWAAMEFLLASQKKSRNWILFKQLLLLLLRVMAVAAIVLMLAQPHNQWAALLSHAKTHHIVLVDDSYSMSDRTSDSSALDRAKEVVLRLADQAARADNPQVFTLLRFSEAGAGDRNAQPDMLQEPLTGGSRERITSIVASWKPTQLASGPYEALEAIERLPHQSGSEERVVYLISDFRANQWDDPAEIREALARLEQQGAHLELVDCVETAHANLGIADLRITSGIRAAGVPLWMTVTVTNFASAPARDVSVTLAEDGLARPAVVIEQIPAGKSVTRRFPVVFAAAGQHRVSAQLESDAIAADNVRYAVVEVADTSPVLVIDGDPKASDATFLSTALSPGGKVKSGVSPLIESPRFLRDHALDGYDAVFLLNFERLDVAEIEALEAYVRAGGGVGIFLGELNQADFLNKHLYRDGAGLFPLPLVGVTELLVDRTEEVPDVEVTDHPIFSVFAGERNSFIGSILVEHYFAAAKNWTPASDAETQVIARLRNGAPLAVEHRMGEGRVVAFLTKAGPGETPQGSWNNWGRNNPSFVVAMLELEAYLAASRHATVSSLVGAPLATTMPLAQYQPQVRFVLPADQGGGTLTVDAEAAGTDQTATLTDTHAAGIYEAQWTLRAGGEIVPRQFALNVDPREGNLQRLDSAGLAQRLPGIKYLYSQAQDVAYDGERLSGPNLGRFFMWLLIGVLLAEQILAYSASYHPVRRGAVH